MKEVFNNIRNEYQFKNEARLVGCIGRIVPQKGQKVFLLAIPGVTQKYPETFFLIVGDIFLKEEGYKKELLEMIKKNGIEKRVKFTGFRTDVEDVIRSLDIVIFPSIAPEAFPLTLLEAMALGKPVIASDIGGTEEIIENGVNGLLVEPNRPEQITERILHLFDHQEVSDRIGQMAKEAVNRKYSLQNYVKGMEKACKEAVGGMS